MSRPMGEQAWRDDPIDQLFSRWQLEHRDLLRVVDDLRHWMYEVNQLGQPRFGETADELDLLRDQLVRHFARENEMTGHLRDSEPGAEVELQAMYRQSTRAHELLLNRLDELAERLRLIEPPFATWQRAVDEVELLVDALEEHEAKTAESMQQWIRLRVHAE